jgi:hypothetical protein
MLGILKLFSIAFIPYTKPGKNPSTILGLFKLLYKVNHSLPLPATLISFFLSLLSNHIPLTQLVEGRR